MINISQAILPLRPNAAFVLHNDDYSTIEWLNDVDAPTIEEIEEETLRLETEEKANLYKELRAKEYPSIGDQLDSLFHAGVFPEEMTLLIQSIKDKYPKS